MNQLLEHWQQERTMELLHTYLHSGRSGGRFQCCEDVLRALEREHQTGWEELLQSETSCGRLAPAA